jgi:hypothetical protein
MIVMEQMLSEDSVDFDYHKLTNDDIKKCFKMETMRLFLDFVYDEKSLLLLFEELDSGINYIKFNKYDSICMKCSRC